MLHHHFRLPEWLGVPTASLLLLGLALTKGPGMVTFLRVDIHTALSWRQADHDFWDEFCLLSPWVQGLALQPYCGMQPYYLTCEA